MRKKIQKKGFTIIELIAVITVLLVIVIFAYINFAPSFERGTKKALTDEAHIMAEGAINLDADERVDKKHVSDIFAGTIENKRCYSIKRLIGDYVKKDDQNYTGSVEVCYGDSCTYKAKIWLTDGKRYFDGVVVDDSLEINNITSSTSSQHFDSCNVDVSNVKNEYEFDYTGKEEVFTVSVDGNYSFEAWGASGGNAYIVANQCDQGGPQLRIGGKGSYSYNEVFLRAGQKIYINVGGEGTFYTHEDKPGITVPGGFNGGGYADYRHGGGGGATNAAFKSGIINNLSVLDLIIVAGGGGGGMYEPGPSCHEFYADGTNAGGYCTQGNIYRNYSFCNNGGYYGFQTNRPSVGGGYNTSPGGNNYFGGTGFIGNPTTKNGIMITYLEGTQDAQISDDPLSKTVKAYEYSEQPEPMKAKLGNGYLKITKLTSSNS